MSNIWNFFVEVLCDGAWQPPEKLAPKGRWDFPTSFTWMHRGSHHWLFLGDQAIFPFPQGSPPPSESSPLCNFIATDWWTNPDTSWEDQCRPHWIGYEALSVDLWNEPGAVLVQSRVPAECVKHFGRGQQNFPEAALLAAGCTRADLNEWWRNARFADQPVEAGFDPRPSQQRWPDKLTEVTWKVSVRELLGEETADDFLALRQYGADHDLRVIALWQ